MAVEVRNMTPSLVIVSALSLLENWFIAEILLDRFSEESTFTLAATLLQGYLDCIQAEFGGILVQHIDQDLRHGLECPAGRPKV